MPKKGVLGAHKKKHETSAAAASVPYESEDNVAPTVIEMQEIAAAESATETTELLSTTIGEEKEKFKGESILLRMVLGSLILLFLVCSGAFVISASLLSAGKKHGVALVCHQADICPFSSDAFPWTLKKM